LKYQYRGQLMIEVFDSKARHLARCCERERLAAQTSHNNEAKQIHQKLAMMYEREATRFGR